MIEERETTSVSTAIRAVCSAWLVHPLVFLGGGKAVKPGAPAAGVPR